MDLCHSFVVNYLSKGDDMRTLQEILGHDNVFDTKRLYGEAVKKKVTETVASPFE